MKKFIFLISLLASAHLVKGVVIYHNVPQSIVALTPENFLRFDFDGNGVVDWQIATFLRETQTFRVQINSPQTTSFLYEKTVGGNVGIDFQPIFFGDIIGPDSENSSQFYATPAVTGVSPFATSFPAPSLADQDHNFIGETAYLGFRFQGEEGVHYGYALLTGTTSRGTTILATAWETEPGKAIVAGAIPEPTSAFLFLFGLSFLYRRKRSETTRIPTS